MPLNTFKSYVAVAFASAALGFAAIYATLGGADNATATGGDVATVVKTAAPDAAPPAGEVARSNLNPLSTGTMTTFIFKKAPEDVPEVTFVDKDGQPRSLKEWRGKVVLLNLWATWCAPCRKEMPSLDRLSRELGSDKFEVVALAIDRAGKDAAGRFLDQVQATGLKLYVDGTARMSTPLKVVGLPTTLLIDKDGREIGRLTGPAEWDAPEAQALIKAQL
jgi:thiol-disulfide isomerase/thioredoxin